jgi:hypothetical protein
MARDLHPGPSVSSSLSQLLRPPSRSRDNPRRLNVSRSTSQGAPIDVDTKQAGGGFAIYFGDVATLRDPGSNVITLKPGDRCSLTFSKEDQGPLVAFYRTTRGRRRNSPCHTEVIEGMCCIAQSYTDEPIDFSVVPQSSYEVASTGQSGSGTSSAHKVHFGPRWQGTMWAIGTPTFFCGPDNSASMGEDGETYTGVGPDNRGSNTVWLKGAEDLEGKTITQRCTRTSTVTLTDSSRPGRISE